MQNFQNWLSQLQLSNLWDTLLIAAASLICITVHEVCHGLAAYHLGDPTAKRLGRLSLNPIRHIDIIGLLLLIVAKFGWAKPVPVNPCNFKHPKRDMAITAAAGPISNVLLAAVGYLVYSVVIFFYYRSGGQAGWLEPVMDFLAYVILISAGLAVFNLFPIPPLDGSKILFAVLPDRAYAVLMRYERLGMAALVAILYLGWLDRPLDILRQGLMSGLSFCCNWPFDLLQRLFL